MKSFNQPNKLGILNNFVFVNVYMFVITVNKFLYFVNNRKK